MLNSPHTPQEAMSKNHPKGLYLKKNSSLYLERKSHQPSLVFMQALFLKLGQIGIMRCNWFLWREQKQKTWIWKNPQSKARTNNKLNSHMALGWNQTQSTLVGGKC